MQIQAEHPVAITNPEKLLWPEANVSKAHYMEYLTEVAPVILPHLKDRPLTMIRYPHGIHGHSFYQKSMPTGTPDWVTTTPVWSSDRADVIHCILVDSVATLLWLANLACLELHVGFTTVQNPEEPTAIAFDLDPSVPGFEPVREVAMTLHGLLQRLDLPHTAKTSGATGLQVFIPLAPGHSFADTRVFTRAVADYLLQKLPTIVTLERLKQNRGQKVYVDYPQHGQNRTLIAPYSARATVHATVSTPLTWGEVGRSTTVPEDFTIHNVARRVAQMGDLLRRDSGVKLKGIVDFLSQHPRALH